MRHAFRYVTAVALALAVVSGAPASAQTGAATLPLEFRRTYTNEEVEAALRALAAAHPERTELIEAGRSLEDRPIFALTIHDPSTGPAGDKAAIYIDGNIHGNEVQGTEVCLYTAQVLLSDGARDPLVARVLRERVVYILPIVNPDGRAHFLADPNNPHTSRHNRRPWDDDGDGRADEDGPDDIDGDGLILAMRKRDPRGDWVTGDDPRLVTRRRPDQPGEFRLWWTEGTDEDGDGAINEDGPGGVDLNRNFPSAWQPRGTQWGAGDYPLSEPEAQAVASFILARPHVAAIQSYHNFGDMILRPPGSSTDAAAEVPPRDKRIYDALGKRGEVLLPGYRYLQTFQGLYPVRGGFLDWGYLGLGAITFTNELWSMPADYDKKDGISAAERLRWSDENLEGRGYIAWYPVTHPTLGEVELGGWHPMSRRIPPGWLLEDVCARNCRFTLVHADAMPKVAIAEVALERLGPSLWRVEASLANEGVIDTVTDMGERLRVVRPDRAELVAADPAAPVRVLWAGIAEDPLLPRFRPVERRPERVDLPALRGQSAVRGAWIVEGPEGAGIELTLRSQMGGAARAAIRLD
jgi:hypothetical protein